MSTLREQLLEATAPPTEEVSIRGIAVNMTGLGMAEMSQLANVEDGFDATFWLLSRMLRDKDGAAVFEDENDPVLRGMDPAIAEELAGVARRLLGVAASAKNSEAVQLSAD